MALPRGVRPSMLPGRLRDLVRVPIDYVLEVHANGSLHGDLSVTLPNAPETIRVSRPGATSVDFTLGIDPIREHTRNRFYQIELTGRSGVAPRSGYDREGLIIFKDGPTILHEFDKFLDIYQEFAENVGALRLDPEQYRRGTNDIYLVFRALKEDLHLKVEVDDWTWDRNRNRTNLGREWTLRLRAYGLAKRKVPTSIIAPLDEWAQRAADAIAFANAVGAALDNALRNTRSDLDALRAPLRELQRSAALARNIVASTANLAAFPRDALSDVAYAAEGFVAAWNDAEIAIDDFSLTGDFMDRMRRLGGQAEDAARDAVTAYGGLGGGPDGLTGSRRAREQADGVAGGFTPPTPSRGPRRAAQQRSQAAVYALRPGDSLRTIAQAVYGDAERWIEIAFYNGWLDAYRHGSGRPARTGDEILLPGVSDVPASGIERVATEDDLFGRDIYLNPETGDLEITGDGTDVRTVRGRANLMQALSMRLRSTQGESRVFPQWGLPVVPGDVVHTRMVGYIGAHVRDQLSADPRIASIGEMTVIDEGDRVVVDVQVVPTSGAAFGVIAPLAVGDGF